MHPIAVLSNWGAAGSTYRQLHHEVQQNGKKCLFVKFDDFQKVKSDKRQNVKHEKGGPGLPHPISCGGFPICKAYALTLTRLSCLEPLGVAAMGTASYAHISTSNASLKPKAGRALSKTCPTVRFPVATFPFAKCWSCW